MSNRWATLYTDYSGLGGWAIWARSDYGRIVRNGSTDIDDSSAGELFAILQGIIIIKSEWREITGISVYTDSQVAVKIAKFNAPKPRRDDLVDLQLQIRQALGECFIKCTWVKGHQKQNTVKAYLNGQCDRLAREAN